MNSKHVKIAFSLLFLGILPIMGMNNENSTSKQLEIALFEQKSYFNDFDINEIDTISKNDPERGLLLELHLKDLLSIKKITPNESIKKILTAHKDNQQEKMMGLIECANFISSPFLEKLIQYALAYNLMSKKLSEGPDTTVKSFYEIKNVYTAKSQKTLQLMGELFQNFKLESDAEYPLDHNFYPVINDIKTIKYENDTKNLDLFHNLTAFDVKCHNNTIQISTDSEKKDQRKHAEKTLRALLNSTSLPNKISLILRLNELAQLVSNNIDIVANNHELSDLVCEIGDRLQNSIIGSILAGCVSLSINIPELENERLPVHSFLLGISFCSCFMTGIAKIFDIISLNQNMSLSKCFWDFGSYFGLPIPTLYYIYQYYTKKLARDKQLLEMEGEQKNIQNLIEEFKESIKNEYAL